jgi:hypothetical protein
MPRRLQTLGTRTNRPSETREPAGPVQLLPTWKPRSCHGVQGYLDRVVSLDGLGDQPPGQRH